MASTIIVRHQGDRCHQTVDLADDVKHPGALPEGWMLISVAGQPHLLCTDCQDGLRAFMRANEAVEQSR
jgi:hypothetical protein